jgi:hypothetical protein
MNNNTTDTNNYTRDNTILRWRGLVARAYHRKACLFVGTDYKSAPAPVAPETWHATSLQQEINAFYFHC